MGGAAGVGDPRLGTDRTGGPDRAYGWIANGCTAMNPRRLRLGFILAAAGMLYAVVLPLSSEAVAPLPARPIWLALTLASALLFAVAAWTGGSSAIAPGFAGVLCGAATTLALLRDPGVGVPPVLMPSPSAAAARFVSSLPTLGADFVQTFVRGVLIGYVIGCGAGLLVAIVAQRFAFLGRGLLPL